MTTRFDVRLKLLLRCAAVVIASVDSVPAVTPLKSKSSEKVGSKSGWERTLEGRSEMSSSRSTPEKV